MAARSAPALPLKKPPLQAQLAENIEHVKKEQTLQSVQLTLSILSCYFYARVA